MKFNFAQGRLESMNVDAFIYDFSQPLNPDIELDSIELERFKQLTLYRQNLIANFYEPGVLIDTGLKLNNKSIIYYDPLKFNNDIRVYKHHFRDRVKLLIDICLKHGISSIALRPLKSIDDAITSSFLLKTFYDVFHKVAKNLDIEVFIVYEQNDYELSKEEIDDFDVLIEQSIDERLDAIDATQPEPVNELYKARLTVNFSYNMSQYDIGKTLDKPEESFSERLNKLMYETGMSGSQIWKKAMIDRKLFSKISSGNRPSKNTAILISLALELSLDDALDLISRAGYTLSKSFKEDIIIRKCIENGLYSVLDIVDLQLQYGTPTLI